MKKMVLILIFISFIFVFSSVSIKADEYQYNGYSFDYYDYSYYEVYPKLIVNCTYPDDIPHTYSPYEWAQQYTERWEEVYLALPHTDDLLSGVFGNDTFTFYLEEALTKEGNYNLELVANNSELLFECSFNMEMGFSIQANTNGWYYSTDAGGYSSSHSIDKKSTPSILGISITLLLQNTKDIPYPLGSPSQINLPITFNYKLYKIGNSDPIFSSENISLSRADCEFDDSGPRQAYYFEPSEQIEYSNIIENSAFKSIDSGKYFIQGEVNIGNLTYQFITPESLSIQGEQKNSAGFEIIILLFAIMAIYIGLRKKK